jgi:type VI secretion system protein ImpJ
LRLLSPVVWSEGMHLAQHHFQAQSRYFEDLAAFAIEQLAAPAWGVADIGLDAEALRNGTAALTHARGILPDGTAFHVPHDPPPEPLDIRERFSPTHDAHLLLLALPAFVPDRANCALDGGRGHAGLRFRAETLPVVDETTGAQERPVGFARKNVRLLLDGEDADGLVAMPVARIRRDGTGSFLYDPAYIPPALRIGASPRLLELLDRLVGILDAKAESLAADRRQDGAGLAEYAAREVAGFWLSHAIHSALPALRHMLRTRAAHPEALFAEMSRLGGALCTFSLDAHPRDLPLYVHDAADAAFDALDRHIRRHLELVLPSGAIVIPLRPAVTVHEGRDEVLRVPDTPVPAPTFFAGSVADTRVFGRAHWFLGVRSSASQAQVVSRVPELVKICASRFVARLVREALPGLGIEYVASPPADLGPRIGMHYFRLHRTDPCWTTIARSGEVGVYVPAAIPDLELSLSVLLES